jgi:hypothetical protein
MPSLMRVSIEKTNARKTVIAVSEIRNAHCPRCDRVALHSIALSSPITARITTNGMRKMVYRARWADPRNVLYRMKKAAKTNE